MSESVKAVLGGLIFLCSIGAFVVWSAKGVIATPIVVVLRVLLPLVVVGSVALLIRAYRRKDEVPDFLRQLFGTPFERDGFCFSVMPVKLNGMCYLAVFFQNQYERPCYTRVVVQPPLKTFSFGARQFDGISIDINCPGAALGLARVPLAVPAKCQGNRVRFDVAAATHYPGGAGELLRFRNGMRVGRADASGLGSAARTVGLLAVGVISISQPAHATMLLPSGVAETLPAGARPEIRTIWQPGGSVEQVPEMMQRALAQPVTSLVPDHR